MARTLYVASTNPGKLRDFAVAAAAHDTRILPLPGLAAIEPPAEDAPTFEDIAREKAIYYSRFLPGEIVLADDSGLEVDALQGAPGVRSARYAADAGFHADGSTDDNNNLFLLQQLARVPESERGARYQCVLAAARDGAALLTAQAPPKAASSPLLAEVTVSDTIPSFICPPAQCTMAEMDDQTKWTLSHRGHAFRALLELLG